LSNTGFEGNFFNLLLICTGLRFVIEELLTSGLWGIMKRPACFKSFCPAIGILLFWSAVLAAQVNVTTYHYDNARTGQNTQETILTPGNVTSSQFGKLFTVPVDGYVYAQPLYLANVQNIAGGTHNVLFVATEHDSLYALDADNGNTLWQKSFINPPHIATVTSGEVSCGDLVPEIGITSTPVIDQSTGTIYLLTKTNENGVYFQRLHALDILTHAEKFGGPVAISASVNGQTFDPLRNSNRPGLLLENGHVVIAWASHCDNTPYHGWVMSYKAGVQPTDTMTQEAVFNGSPNGGLAGIWMSGDGVAADSSGNLFFATGNGTYDGLADGDFGDSIMKLGPPSNGAFGILDWFTPWNQQNLSDGDIDLGSGGLLLLPELPAGAAHRDLLVEMGKEGKIYLVDRNGMGKFCSTCTSIDTQIVQEIPGATTGIWGSPSYWNGSVYWGGGNDGGAADHVKAFSFNANSSGMLSSSPTSKSTKSFSFSTAAPVISANVNANGILWILDNSSFGSSCCQVLYAYDATNLANLFYDSNQAGNSRDVPGGSVKFTSPMVANGKVYVGSQAGVSAYGLLPSSSMSTNTSLISSLNPAYVTQPVTFTATVSAQSGTPAGSVTFLHGKITLAKVPLTSGQASYTTRYTKASKLLVAATYSGDSTYIASTSPTLTQLVRGLPAATTTVITTSGSPSQVGQSVTFSATVSSPFGAIPDGETVTFTMGTAPLGTGTLSGGVATYTTSSLPVGNHNIKALYPGDSNFKKGSAFVAELVQK